MLDEAGDRVAAILGQITSLISTSTSLRMVGYFLRAILAHRLKFNAQNNYKRLARDTLAIKSPADIAAFCRSVRARAAPLPHTRFRRY